MNKITKCLILLSTLVLMAIGCTPSAKSPSPRARLSAGTPQLRGTNLTGGDMSYGQSNTSNPVSGTDYLFVSHQDIDYLVSKKVGFGRLVFSWEGVQPTLNGPLATTGGCGTYVSTFIDRVNYATSKGMYIMVEPHGAGDTNFAKYKGNLVGTAAVPNGAFADFWSRVATQFKDNPRVVFGLTNEPHAMSTVQWFQAAQAAVLGIRATGATNLILVPGNGWTAAESWTSSYYDTASPAVSNATAFLQYIKDPIGNTGISVHMYFDQNSGGGASDVVSPTIGVERVKVTVDWARANGVKVHLGEFGTIASSQAQVAVKNLLDYFNANQDVVIGWSWWTYGPPAWWGGYQFTLDPSSNYTVDAPQMAWLTPYFVTVPTPESSFPTNPIAYTKNAKGTIVVNGVTSWIFVPQGYDSTHNTPTKLFVWLHGCGGQSQYDADMVSWMPNQSWISLAVGGRETTCWSSYANDGAKILAAIAGIKTHFNIDPKRVVLGGYSSGGDIGYELGFKNASLFAGMIFENTGPSSAALTASNTAFWKLNIAHLAHTGDTTYPIATVRTNMTTLRSQGYPVTLIEKAGGHYDNDSGASGTQFDLRNFLLPYLDAGWVSGVAVPPPTPAACVYAYSAWSACQSSGTQTRTATSSPVGCVGTPTLSQTCTYVPLDTDGDGISDSLDKCPTVKGIATTDGTSNGCLPLVVTSVKTYDWGSGYCRQYYFKNPNTVNMSWKTFKISLGDGKLRGTGAVWGATFPNATATGTVKVTPAGNAMILPGQKLQAVGYCADYGPSKSAGVSGGLTY